MVTRVSWPLSALGQGVCHLLGAPQGKHRARRLAELRQTQGMAEPLACVSSFGF